ncbi:GGDEF domain-containing protein [Azonexus sp. R2A61]|uniref:GGDEF domain-containing protein n=1 Tax=Azonexus sp. R2A61 TaxID=2744443 RepID=UPI001F1BDA15|nr:GGDEF domain-containing protein [Azonexus sp. R2A61]
MNSETAYVIGALMMLANGGVLGLVHRDLLPSLRPSAVSWRIGTLLIAGGCLIILGQKQLPAHIILPLANGMIMLGFTGYWRAIRQFYDLPDRFWMLLPFAAGTLSTFWFTAIVPAIGARVLAVTLCWLALFSFCSATLLSPRLQDNALSRRVLAWIFVGAAGFALLRLMLFVLPGMPPIDNVVDSSNWINIATPMVAGIMPVVGTTAFLLMCSERLRRQWEHAASTDYLTGLANRRTLAEAGERRFREMRRGDQRLAVAVIDIDHFKSINDRHGHDTGDQALRHVAGTLERHCRNDELPGRQGGEEFVVVLSVSGPEEASQAGERLRQAVESQPFRVGDITMPVTVSIGIACQTPSDASFDQLLGRADSALYTAKDSGRNRVESAN